VRPAMPAECLLDRNALIWGLPAFTPAFSNTPSPGRALCVPGHQLLHRAVTQLIGGQEDQLIDIALEIQREQENGAAVSH